jgi:hypothetical protein
MPADTCAVQWESGRGGRGAPDDATKTAEVDMQALDQRAAGQPAHWHSNQIAEIERLASLEINQPARI